MYHKRPLRAKNHYTRRASHPRVNSGLQRGTPSGAVQGVSRGFLTPQRVASAPDVPSLNPRDWFGTSPLSPVTCTLSLSPLFWATDTAPPHPPFVAGVELTLYTVRIYFNTWESAYYCSVVSFPVVGFIPPAKGRGFLPRTFYKRKRENSTILLRRLRCREKLHQLVVESLEVSRLLCRRA